MLRKPTLNIGQLVHVVKQVENLTGKDADDLVDELLSGRVSDSLKRIFYDTVNRLKSDPIEVGTNSAIYALVYSAVKKHLGPYCKRVDLGLFYLKAI